MPASFDVVIVGAGASGLAAAGQLAGSGLGVAILEARDRIGGRIFTQEDDSSHIELGAEFIHGMAPEIWEPLQAKHVSIQELQGDAWCHRAGRLSTCDFFSDIEEVLGQMDAEHPDESFLSFLRRSYPPSKVSPKQRDVLDRSISYVTGFNAADPDRVGVHWLVKGARAEEEIEGDRTFRAVKGYHSLVRIMADKVERAGIPIQTEAVVSSISWRPRQVDMKVRERKQIVTAKAALITIPLGVLKAWGEERGAIRFAPELPEAKREALTKLEMGKVVRVTFRFRRRFWDQIVPEGAEKSLASMRFLFSQDAWFPTWWTASPDRAPTLTGWAPFRSAEKLSELPRSKVFQCGLQTLGSLLKFPASELEQLLEAAYFHNWQDDPFARGAYSYGAVGADDAQEALGRPVDGTLFFAGEATDTTGNNGTVHGAIASGNRAADEILKSFR